MFKITVVKASGAVFTVFSSLRDLPGYLREVDSLPGVKSWHVEKL